ncbi:MAG TPA: hypothetical protein VFO91_03945 [Anaerolineales bacterium]|nr:hypothetical protein [Anaerolineales bacterium]
MAKKRSSDNKIEITVGGDVSGQLAAGNNITQVSKKTDSPVTKADIEELHQLFKQLRAQVEAEANAAKQDAALERVDELEQAITEEKPDLSTMEYVKNWFVRNLPGLAGTVTSVVVHPIVGKLVEAGGDALVGEFRRRFGGTPP